MFTYPITIHHIYISPGHNYFGHQPDQIGTHPTADVDEVQAIAEKGLQGDRFFGVRPNFDGQVTFFSFEVFRLLVDEIGPESLAPSALRRNIIVQGMPLNQLIGHDFTILWEKGRVDFRGARHCHPCRWMDLAAAQGALKFLKGRGGLRAQLLSDGLIQKGDATLTTRHELNLQSITTPLARPRLP
ncbi:MAG: MOSC domain-containing protein [Chloroflexota bacterium]